MKRLKAPSNTKAFAEFFRQLDMHNQRMLEAEWLFGKKGVMNDKRMDEKIKHFYPKLPSKCQFEWDLMEPSDIKHFCSKAKNHNGQHKCWCGAKCEPNKKS